MGALWGGCLKIVFSGLASPEGMTIILQYLFDCQFDFYYQDQLDEVREEIVAYLVDKLS